MSGRSEPSRGTNSATFRRGFSLAPAFAQPDDSNSPLARWSSPDRGDFNSTQTARPVNSAATVSQRVNQAALPLPRQHGASTNDYFGTHDSPCSSTPPLLLRVHAPVVSPARSSRRLSVLFDNPGVAYGYALRLAAVSPRRQVLPLGTSLREQDGVESPYMLCCHTRLIFIARTNVASNCPLVPASAWNDDGSSAAGARWRMPSTNATVTSVFDVTARSSLPARKLGGRRATFAPWGANCC